MSRHGGHRASIHMHPSGDVICILEGENISAFVEREKDLVGLKKEGHYAMPANRKMGTYTESPFGYKDMNIFRAYICYPTWVVLEAAIYPIQYRQFPLDPDQACE